MEILAVTCPSCFEVFEVPLADSYQELVVMDYDCEICCRPMVLELFPDGQIEAKSLDDL